MRTMKRMTAIILSFVLFMVSDVATRAAVTNSQPVKSRSEAQLKWQWPEKKKAHAMQTISDLKIVGNYVYAADNGTKKVVKINKQTGKVEAEHKFYDFCEMDYYGDLAYGNGQIYIEYTNHKVEAFDADTLKPVWISEKTDEAVTSKLTYDQGHLYFGTGSYGDKSSSYYMLDTTDEDKNKEDEVKKIKKLLTSDQGIFYWKKAVKSGEYLIVSDTIGNLTSIDTKDNHVVQTKSTGIEFTGNIAYDEENNMIYFVGGTNELYGVKIKENGTLGEAERKAQFYEKGRSAMTPVVYNGRIYVSGTNGESFSSDAKIKGFFGVASIYGDDCKVEYTLPIANYSQCEPVIAKRGKDSVQVYFTVNAEPGGIYSITDTKGNKTSVVDTIYEPVDEDQINYCMKDICVDDEGNMYYSNDSGYIFAVGKKTLNTTIINETKVKPVTKTVKSERSVKLTWKKNKSAKGYVIYAKAGKGKYKKVTTVGKKTSKTIKVNKDSSYKFKVKPYKLTKKNKKKYYKTYAAKAKFGSKTVKVTFKNVTGFASYKVEMKAGKAAYKTVKTTAKGGTITYTKKKAKVGTTYKFRLKGINKANGKTVTTVIK